MVERIGSGDVVVCKRCGEPCRVKTYDWEAVVHIIHCRDGIHIVGIDDCRVPQRTLVDSLVIDAAISADQ